MPLARARPPVRPTVRLRPVPPLDPPFDDECVPETWVELAPSSGGVPPAVERFRSAVAERPHPGRSARSAAVPTSPTRPTDRPATPGVRPGPSTSRATALPDPGTSRATALPDPGTSRATAGPPVADAVAGATPEAKRAAKRFLDTCLEIVNGYRPAWHVRALASPPDAAAMVAQLASATSRVCGRRRPGQPVHTVRLRRLRVCEPRPGVVEAAAVVGVAGRTWAMAFRIERRRGSWVGTAVALL
ncbi:Rv3235 family protein [Plantactinospora sp. KLBMP9567]|uniref:Rv3235 family protein n=1 Tax=Plantactinospora sp. KLBMP9567 TaxID=3085900 RepID=UPI002980FDAC|nr:Rv3235 family protein [Plantactinospora sp. KLBMP9567]MDW5329907.1 Rv3235 family protein [Plantactinospora sp. KLBMP9567]